MYLRMVNEFVFKRVGQAINQRLLYLGIEGIGIVDRSLVYGLRDLVPICSERSYANSCWVSPMLDTNRRSVPETKFIPLYSMSIHFELLFFFDGLLQETPIG